MVRRLPPLQAPEEECVGDIPEDVCRQASKKFRVTSKTIIVDKLSQKKLMTKSSPWSQGRKTTSGGKTDNVVSV